MPYINNQGIKIYYEVIGSGFPVVLHTGAGGDRRMWQEAGYVAGLVGFQSILLDHRGHGKSDKPRELAAHRLAHYVADVIAILDSLHLPRVAFWGYSDGRCVGYELAHRSPERVAALLASGGVEAADAADFQAERQQRAVRASFI
jgi:pimeloyl-ACP methyl ester carboxylesterase